MPLNEAQSRAIGTTLAHVSQLLDGVLKVSRGDLNPFDEQRQDLTEAEAGLLTELVSAIRKRMLQALDELGLPAPQPHGSARWSARTTFFFSDIALSELSGRGLRRYGALDDESERLVSSVVEDLRRLLERAEGVLQGVGPASAEASVEGTVEPAGDSEEE